MSTIVYSDFWEVLLGNNVKLGNSDVVGDVTSFLMKDIAAVICEVEASTKCEIVDNEEVAVRKRLTDDCGVERLFILSWQHREEYAFALKDLGAKHRNAVYLLGGYCIVEHVYQLVIARMSATASTIRWEYAALPQARAFDCPNPSKLYDYILRVAYTLPYAAMDQLFRDLCLQLTTHFHHAEKTSDMHGAERKSYDARNRIQVCYCRARHYCNDSNHVGAHVWRLDGQLGLLSTCSKCNNAHNTPNIGFFTAAQYAPFAELPESRRR